MLLSSLGNLLGVLIYKILWEPPRVLVALQQELLVVNEPIALFPNSNEHPQDKDQSHSSPKKFTKFREKQQQNYCEYLLITVVGLSSISSGSINFVTQVYICDLSKGQPFLRQAICK